MQYRILPNDDYLHAHIDGLVFVEAWDEVLRGLADAIKDAQSDRLVVNLEGLVGWLGVPERRSVGGLLAAHLGQMKKVALIIEREKITGVVQAEAQLNGLDLRLFSSYRDAVSWVGS